MLGFEFAMVVKAWPGIFGSALSLLWVKEPQWRRRAAMFVAGALISVVALPEASRRLNGMDVSLLSFLLGLVSITFLSKVFETWNSFNLGGLLRDMSRKWAGLPPKATEPAPLSNHAPLSKDD